MSHLLYPRTLLVVILASDAEYDNVDLLRSVYVHAFRRIVFYGLRGTDDVEACELTISTPSDAAYRCVAHAVMLCSGVRGLPGTAERHGPQMVDAGAAQLQRSVDACITLTPPAGIAEAVWDARLGGRWAEVTTGYGMVCCAIAEWLTLAVQWPCAPTCICNASHCVAGCAYLGGVQH